MKNYENFLAIREKISQDEGRIPGLQDELVLKQKAQVQLDEEARRAWALDQPDAGKLKAAAEENEKAVVRLEEELKKLKKRVELMKKDTVPAAEAALKDLREHYRALVEPLVGELTKRYRAAMEIEMRLRNLRNEADTKTASVTPYSRIILPFIGSLVLGQQGELRDQTPLAFWLKDMKREGFIIPEEK